MAINFPTSLDTLTNPASNNTLDSPSHSGQHSDVNDAVEALETKLGSGANDNVPAANKILRGTGAGTSEWDFDIKDEDNMASDSATAVPTQQSVKAYADTNFFKLADDETVTGRPAFNGGTSGVSSPFTVDSQSLVTNLNADLLDGQHSTYFAKATEMANGWIALDTATYEASDDPTYTLSFASDMTGILSAGMRLKVTDSTVQYFIITGVGAFSGGKTIITLYGGTDYNLSGGAITLPYYSVMKAPFGFPLNPTKWTQAIASLNSGGQSAPTQNVWYNTGSNSLVIPIGCWKVSYSAYPIGQKNSATDVNIEVTLSTANNSESDTTMTRVASILGAVGNINIGASMYADRFLTLTTKTTYHLNIRSTTATVTILYMNTDGYIKAVCAYL